MAFLEFCSTKHLFAKKCNFHKTFQWKRKLNKKSSFWAKGCFVEQNSRKETPLKIQFYFQDNINLFSEPFLNLLNGICFFYPHFHPLCLLAGILQPDFQIAVTPSILKLKSILLPPFKMSWSGVKHAQD